MKKDENIQYDWILGAIKSDLKVFFTQSCKQQKQICHL